MEKPRYYSLNEPYREPLQLTLKPGMAWAMYMDHGPLGPCGQSMSVTCPHCVFAIWPSEPEMRRSMEAGVFRKGSKSNMQYGVIGEYSTGQGSIVIYEDNGGE